MLSTEVKQIFKILNEISKKIIIKPHKVYYGHNCMWTKIINFKVAFLILFKAEKIIFLKMFLK